MRSIGGPWAVARRIAEREIERPGTLLLGRAGPSVALLVGDEVDPDVVVGRPVGTWPDPATLEWSVVDVEASLRVPHRDAPSAYVDDFLASLGDAVEAVFERVRPSLVICRYCGRIVASELALDDSACYACGAHAFGTAD